ncbi:hypothetical protein [Chryseolinea lacunae]|uniref:Phosphate ABC transporter substrate-binding protein n=1 Tax=Chryseolinea lacunae TaxID=2801331 RepID=A0ABS1KQF1_9BACT|nr:hypothetical protein [Chryseolinea lacunae]MBL0741432.1 hypothetical protein [Chryseolinea lacunae]
MKKQKQMRDAFGVNEFGLVDLPIKISNVRVARIAYGDERGCSYCFPHGCETSNAKIDNCQKNWKRFRKSKWKAL